MKILASILIIMILTGPLEAKEKEPLVDDPQNSDLSSSLAEANDLQFNFKNSEAINLLLAALNRFEANEPSLKDLQKLAEVHLYLAYLYKNQGTTAKMNEELLLAARFNPSLAPDALLFPPSLTTSLEKAKDQVWQEGHFGSMMIHSTPSNLDIFINGAYKGKTPLRLDQFPVGELHLHVKNGDGFFYQKVNLMEGTNPDTTLKEKTKQKKRKR